MLTLLLWVATHWWIAALIGAVALAGFVYSGFVPLAKVIAAFFRLCAAVADFFTIPKDQIGEKLICCVVFFCLGAAPAFYYGKSVVRDQWAAADAKAEKDRKALDMSIGREAAKAAEAAEHKIEELQTELDKKAKANETGYPDVTFDESTARRMRGR